MASPLATVAANRASEATSQFTVTLFIRRPECSSSGRGASRVQMTNPSGAGSPEATPRVNGVSDTLWARTMAGAATAAARPPIRVRRLKGLSSIKVLPSGSTLRPVDDATVTLRQARPEG
jgi:hypothetical protein